MDKKVGVLTAGSDSPGVNAAIRGLGKALNTRYGIDLIGFRDGFTGLVEQRTLHLEGSRLSGILTLGGTILGTSRTVPSAMTVNGELRDLTQKAIDTYESLKLQALVCIGGKETQKAALALSQAGLNVIVVPKGADNDIAGTDIAIGYDTAREVAAQAIDRLHTTANATHRIMIVELMGLDAGWLTLGAGLAAGVDVILIPELPYNMDLISAAIQERKDAGKNFSLVAVAEHARSQELVAFMERAARLKAERKGEEPTQLGAEMNKLDKNYSGETMLLARRLEEATALETRITILGALVRGGTPTAADRLLATQLAEWSAQMIADGDFGRMVGIHASVVGSVPLEEIAGKHKPIPPDHGWIRGAHQLGICLGVQPKV